MPASNEKHCHGNIMLEHCEEGRRGEGGGGGERGERGGGGEGGERGENWQKCLLVRNCFFLVPQL